MVEAEDMQAQAEDTPDGGEERKEKRPKEGGYETIARQEIRRARRLVVDGQPTPEATFSVSIANALALLDLAAAIREHGASK